MSEVKIRFLRDYKVKSVDGEKYRENQSVTVPEASARHFIGRGVAEAVQAAKKPAKKDDE